jgi:molybdopterin converting factor small subunit
MNVKVIQNEEIVKQAQALVIKAAQATVQEARPLMQKIIETLPEEFKECLFELDEALIDLADIESLTRLVEPVVDEDEVER